MRMRGTVSVGGNRSRDVLGRHYRTGFAIASYRFGGRGVGYQFIEFLG